MSKDGFQLTNAAAQMYEAQKVPAMFAPLARSTLARHEVNADDNVLDVACGTGIVSRTIRELFGNEPTVTAIDLNEGMVATARDVCTRDGIKVDFHVCDATATEFDDGQFSYVICQQGLQYFPDEDAALAELRRVTSPGGRGVFTVWSRPSPLIAALSESLRSHAGDDLAQQSMAPFSWDGADTIVKRMTEVGYVGINSAELEVDRVISGSEQSISNEIMSTPVGPLVAAMGDEVFDTVVTEMIASTERFRRGEQLVVPQHTHLISAIAG